MRIRQCISINDLSNDSVLAVFDELDATLARPDPYTAYFTQNNSTLKGRILCTFFREESIRSLLGFQSAFMRQGGNVMTFSALERLFLA